MTRLNHTKTLVSILINNYNYGQFLKEAIDSALNQSYLFTEVVVVDDGSTDNSREIITSYGNKIIPVLKQNGGQASAFNAGFEACHGDVICFLDSDDIFDQNKVEESISFLTTKIVSNPLVLVYHPLEVVDQNGVSLNQQEPASIRNYGSSNLYEHACKYRFFPYPVSPTSGFVISRELATLIFPIPEQGVRTSADSFVGRAALLLGEVHGINKVLGQYRIHGRNNWYCAEIRKANPKDYKLRQDEFLNKKLKEQNKKPVISFFDSIYSAGYYKRFGSSRELFKLSLKVLKWHFNLRTIKFFIKTFFFLLNEFLMGTQKKTDSINL